MRKVTGRSPVAVQGTESVVLTLRALESVLSRPGLQGREGHETEVVCGGGIAYKEAPGAQGDVWL